MRKNLGIIITTLVVLTLSVLGFVFGFPNLNDMQVKALTIELIVCGASVLYCFIVGEITHNNSQMDKLWSILPIIYTWIGAIVSEMAPRMVIYALIVTLWGIRLTINFGRKGAYSLKFWTGEEDYRWKVLREKKYLSNKYIWMLFDLFFISIYQNVLVLAITFPQLSAMSSNAALSLFDYIAIALSLLFLLIESLADEQQMAFHTTKKKLLSEGKTLSELPEPFNKGFNTTGLWKRSRHPNYLGEQGIWLSLYLFVIGASVSTYYIFNWSMIGPLFLVFLFLGSSSFSESVTNSKYPEYAQYLNQVSRYIPLKKYQG